MLASITSNSSTFMVFAWRGILLSLGLCVNEVLAKQTVPHWMLPPRLYLTPWKHPVRQRRHLHCAAHITHLFAAVPAKQAGGEGWRGVIPALANTRVDCRFAPLQRIPAPKMENWQQCGSPWLHVQYAKCLLEAAEQLRHGVSLRIPLHPQDQRKLLKTKERSLSPWSPIKGKSFLSHRTKVVNEAQTAAATLWLQPFVLHCHVRSRISSEVFLRLPATASLKYMALYGTVHQKMNAHSHISSSPPTALKEVSIHTSARATVVQSCRKVKEGLVEKIPKSKSKKAWLLGKEPAPGSWRHASAQAEHHFLSSWPTKSNAVARPKQIPFVRLQMSLSLNQELYRICPQRNVKQNN